MIRRILLGQKLLRQSSSNLTSIVVFFRCEVLTNVPYVKMATTKTPINNASTARGSASHRQERTLQELVAQRPVIVSLDANVNTMDKDVHGGANLLAKTKYAKEPGVCLFYSCQVLTQEQFSLGVVFLKMFSPRYY